MFSPAVNPSFLTGSGQDWPSAELAAMGYRGLEITPSDLDRMDGWKSDADKAGLKLLSVNAMPELRPYLTGSLHDGVERRRRATVDRLLRVLEAMDREQVGFLLVASGRLAENYQKPEEARALFVASLKVLCAAAGKVSILIQSVPGRLFRSSLEVVSIIEEVKHPSLAAAMDIGHVMQCGATPEDAVGKLGKHLRYVQLHDADTRQGYPRLDRHLPMGQGSANREQVKAAIKGLPVAVNITAPNDPLAAAREALGWL